MTADLNAGDWAADVRRLVEQAPGVGFTTYFDRHEQASLQTAVAAWPFLASLLGLSAPGVLESPEEPEAVVEAPTPPAVSP